MRTTNIDQLEESKFSLHPTTKAASMPGVLNSIEWIEETVSNPNQVVEGYRGRRVAQKVYYVRAKKMLLRVVFGWKTMIQW